MLTHNTKKNNIKFFYCYSSQVRELQMKRKMISVLLALVMLTLATGVFAKQDKVTICHKPGTAAEETLSVAAPALKAHLGHGDTEGACSQVQEPDTDQDGIVDSQDNCPYTANPDQADTDNDGVGDVCDNCPNDANSDQADGNNNGIGAACECEPATVSGTLTGLAQTNPFGYALQLIVPPSGAPGIGTAPIFPGDSFTLPVPASYNSGNVIWQLPAQFYVSGYALNSVHYYSDTFDVDCGKTVTGIQVDRTTPPLP
jgi:hypothetical protein